MICKRWHQFLISRCTIVVIFRKENACFKILWCQICWRVPNFLILRFMVPYCSLTGTIDLVWWLFFSSQVVTILEYPLYHLYVRIFSHGNKQVFKLKKRLDSHYTSRNWFIEPTKFTYFYKGSNFLSIASIFEIWSELCTF